MIQSMTGYGKSEATFENGRLTVEIRSVNGKSADINIKTSLLPKDKEMDMRKKIADVLKRGSIDLFISWDANATESARKINRELAAEYLSQIRELADELGLDAGSGADVTDMLIRMPDVMDAKKQDAITEDNWPAVEETIDKALDALCAYRTNEGEALYRDVTSRISRILELYNEVESHEAERITSIRERIMRAAEELSMKPDKERFEQEIIFYLEKLDINEEKVRLRQHCKYFMDTIDSEPCPGKKLGFILQEMGREINTTGSKANNAEIQKLVVQMKDELEKIREQSMNIL